MTRRLFGRPLTRESLLEWAGGPTHVLGVEVVTHLDGPARGMRVAHVRTGEIAFEVVLDRAADIGRASRRGVPIGWLSPTGLVAPGLVDQHGWGPLRAFGGGLMTTCGLDHVLAPTVSDATRYLHPGRTEHHQPLHGRLSGTPATLLASGVVWDAEEPYAHVETEVRQVSLFGEHLVLRRSVRAPLGGASIHVSDTVRNDGYAPTPHAVLYHVNCGWPVVGPAMEVSVPPGTSTGVGHDEDWRTLPAFEGAERVWQHVPATTDRRHLCASIRTSDIGDGRSAGLTVEYSGASLPYLLQWIAQGAGHRACALEPSSAPAIGPAAPTELAPGEERRYELMLTLLVGE